jgi:hypothetical protein
MAMPREQYDQLGTAISSLPERPGRKVIYRSRARIRQMQQWPEEHFDATPLNTVVPAQAHCCPE